MRAAARAKAKPALPLEYNLLLTATLCLLAFGAVMVYSASSARTLLQGQGDGTAFLVKYLGYGALGLIGMHVVARRSLDVVVKLTGPLLVFAFVCLVLVKLPGVGVTVNGARRWLGAGPLQFQPSEVAKLALVLYGAKILAQRPGRVRTPRSIGPLLLVAGTAVLLVASQPDLGTALVMSFTVAAMLVAAGMPIRYLAMAGGRGLGADHALRAERRLPARAPDDVPRPVGARRRRGLPGGAGPDRARLGRALRPRHRRVGAEDLLPARGPHRLHPGDHRRGARRRRDLRRARASTG